MDQRSGSQTEQKGFILIIYSIRHYVHRVPTNYHTIPQSFNEFGSTNFHEKKMLCSDIAKQESGSNTTQSTQCGTGHFLGYRTFHHDGKVSPGRWGWAVHARPLHYIYHHVQSFGVRSSREWRYTPPNSTLSLNVPVLCAIQGAMSYSYKLRTVSEGIIGTGGGGEGGGGSGKYPEMSCLPFTSTMTSTSYRVFLLTTLS